MRQIDEPSLRIFRSAEGDSGSSSGLFVKCIGMDFEVDVGEEGVCIIFRLNIDTGDTNRSDVVLVLERLC
jgi:hypothetical protein